MKEYPSIVKEIRHGEKIYAFDKLDGQNFRLEWNKKNKFHKFGSRTQLIDVNDKLWGEAARISVEKYEKNLHDIFVANRYEKVICFFEFWGKNSFAGRHQEEPHDVTLIDVSVHKKGFLLPQDFLKTFKDVDTAKMLYYGNCNSEFVELVRERKLDGMTFEGVVCKGQYNTPGVPLMFKVKSLEWIIKLERFCSGDEKLFKQLV